MFRPRILQILHCSVLLFLFQLCFSLSLFLFNSGSLFLYLFLFLFIARFLYFSPFLCFSRFLCSSISPFLYSCISVSQFLRFSIHCSIFLFLSFSVCLYFSVSLCLYFSVSTTLVLFPYFSLFLCFSLTLKSQIHHSWAPIQPQPPTESRLHFLHHKISNLNPCRSLHKRQGTHPTDGRHQDSISGSTKNDGELLLGE